MASDPSAPPPERSERTAAGMVEAYVQIRQAILQGGFPPGTRLSQVKIAEQLGLSRTPVREALRLIEKEGLVTSARGRQVVISPTSMRDLDELYALRITLDATTVRTTVPLLSDADLAEMRAALDAMAATEAAGRVEAGEAAHRLFHLIAIRGAGPRHVDFSARLNEHAERYRRLYLVQAGAGPHSRDEHSAIMAACAARRGEDVAHLLAEHYARVALTIVAQIEPAFEPSLVRAAVRTVLQDRSGPSRKDAADRRTGGARPR